MLGLYRKIPSRQIVTFSMVAIALASLAANWPIATEREDGAAVAMPIATPLVPLPVPRPDVADISRRPAPLIPKKAFVAFENRDIDGGDYAVLNGVSQSVCETRCFLDGQCVAYTFNKWESTCFLKSALSELRIDPRGVSGVLASATATEDKRPAVIQKIRDRRLDGDAYKAFPASYGACAEACLADAQCIGFNLRDESQNCGLLDSAGGSLRAAGSQVGIKLQPAIERRRRQPSPEIPPEMAAVFEAIVRQALR